MKKELSPPKEAATKVRDFVSTWASDVAMNALDSIVQVSAKAAVIEEALKTRLYRWTDDPSDDEFYVIRCGDVDCYELPGAIAAHVDVVADLVPGFWPTRNNQNAKAVHIVDAASQESESSSDDDPWSRCGTSNTRYANPHVLAARYGFDLPYSGGGGGGGGGSSQGVKNSIAVASFHRQFFDDEDLKMFSAVCDLDRDIAVSRIVGKNYAARCNPTTAYLWGCRETLVDLEYAGAIAGDIPLEVYHQSSFLRLFSKLQNATDPPKVVSMSWIAPEYGWKIEVTGAKDDDFADALEVGIMKVSAMGISVVAGSGYGAGNRYGIHVRASPGLPVSSPYVTAVGGTNFRYDSTIGEEMAASSVPSIGFSNFFDTPSWQADEVTAYLTGPGADVDRRYINTDGRAYSDIAALGGVFNMYLAYVGDGKIMGGTGTAAATPVIAAIIAQINDHLLRHGKNTLGPLNPFLYEAGRAGCFNDVTTGSDANDFPAAPGWDPPTGYGTPKFNDLLAFALQAQGVDISTDSKTNPPTTAPSKAPGVSPEDTSKVETTSEEKKKQNKSGALVGVSIGAGILILALTTIILLQHQKLQKLHTAIASSSSSGAPYIQLGSGAT